MSDVAAVSPWSCVGRVPGVAVMLVALVGLFALGAPGFLSPANISNVLVQSTVLLLLALPMTLIIMTEGLDLSMGAVLTLASLMVALVVLATGSIVLGLLAACALGAVFGVLNGWLVAMLGIPPFVATLGTLGMAQGLCLVVSDGQSVVGMPRALRDIYSGTIAAIPIPVLIAISAYVVFHTVLYHTRLGNFIFALGGNRDALRFAGINVERLLIVVYAIGGAMAGLAGVLMTARMSAGHPTAGLGLEFDAIAAVAVGGTSFERGNGWLLGTLLGVLTIGVLRNGLNLLAVPSSVQVSCVGMLVILALFVDGIAEPAMTDATKMVPGRIGGLPISGDLLQLSYRLLAALLICVVLSMLTDSFLSLNNILNVLRQASLLFFIAAGLTLVVLTAGLDLSVGANVGLSACLAGTVIHVSGSPALGVLVGLVSGAAIGVANGVLITALRIPSFIATYGMLWILHGISYWYMAGDTIHGFPPGFRQLGSGYFFGLPIPVYLLMIFLAIGTIFAHRTTWGQEVYAIGANPVAARLSGIPVARRLLLVYTMSGTMAGLASIIFLARLNSAEADIGEALTLPAIASVLIGGTSLFGGVGTVFGTFVGALILTLVLNGMNLLSINANWQPFVTGVIVIIAVWLDRATRKNAP